MKKYIGIETVSAEPMTYGKAYKDGIIPENAYVEELASQDGYKLTSDDLKGPGWLPKEDFEKIYQVAETPVDRVNIEWRELNKKLESLQKFMDGEKFAGLDLEIRAMLTTQNRTMTEYMAVLAARETRMESGKGALNSLSFGQVIPLLESGFAIRRSGWNGKGLMVIKQVPAHITSEIIPKMQSLPDEAKRLILAHGDHIDYTAQCLIFNTATGRADSWVPSISDVFANDWELVTE